MPQHSEGFAKRIADRVRNQLLGNDDPAKERIICIGLPKTATTSLCDALEVLGYRTFHYPPVARIENGECHLRWPWWMNKYDAIADNPVAALYRELHAKFPKAIFILSTREETAWLESCRKHFTLARAEAETRQGTFRVVQSHALNIHTLGANVFDPTTFIENYRRHAAEVRAYFKGNKHYFEIDIGAGQQWEHLCGILNKPVPSVDFPRSNTRSVPWGSEAKPIGGGDASSQDGQHQ